MAKLYYGNGECTIEGNARGVEIVYNGTIDLEDKTPDGFTIMVGEQRILIFPVGTNEGGLNNLFQYSGKLKIISVIVANDQAGAEPCTIHRVMDYSELLATNAEDMTTLSEDLKISYNSVKKISNKGFTNSPFIENIHVKRRYFLADGSPYDGLCHCHLVDNAIMTGGTHTEDSQDLYYKQYIDLKVIDKLIPTRNPSHIPSVHKLRRDQKKKRRMEI